MYKNILNMISAAAEFEETGHSGSAFKLLADRCIPLLIDTCVTLNPEINFDKRLETPPFNCSSAKILFPEWVRIIIVQKMAAIPIDKTRDVWLPSRTEIIFSKTFTVSLAFREYRYFWLEVASL